MSSIAVAVGTKPAVDAPKKFLEQTREIAAVCLAQFFFLADQPCNLDHAAFAFVRKMPME